MTVQFVEEDFVAVWREPESGSDRIVTLVFGDPVEVIGPAEENDDWTEVRILSYFDGPFRGFVRGALPVRDEGVLKVSMVDVQQGDGLIVETPAGKIVFIDGGDNKLFARHAAARFRHRRSTADDPLEIDALIITHGDADHFDGLNDIRRSETLTGDDKRKRLFIHPRRVFHNGLVKSPSEDSSDRRIPDVERFGRTVEENGEVLVVDLYDDPREAPEPAQGAPFRRWAHTLDHWEERGEITFKRVAFGMDAADLFDFLQDEGVRIEIQGPFETTATDPDTGQPTPALPFLHRPKKSAVMHLEQGDDHEGSPSASHTINGHSLALRLTFGNVRINLTGDLNQESMQRMLQNLDPADLEAEIVKAPHHGSHDFDFRALEAMKPVVALISSGDESVMKEYIHPRATLMAALGKVMRGNTGIIFSTELAAFFAVKGDCHRREDLAQFFKDRRDQTFTGEELRRLFTGKPRPEDPANLFYGFERTNFGIVHIRSDGTRVLVFTHSGKKFTNEAYRFTVTTENGERLVTFADEVVTR